LASTSACDSRSAASAAGNCCGEEVEMRPNSPLRRRGSGDELVDLGVGGLQQGLAFP
jgi:hypothetical protein